MKNLIQYIKSLRGILNTIVNDANSENENDILYAKDIENGRQILTQTADFLNQSERSVLLIHVQWLEENFSDGGQESEVAEILRAALETKIHVIETINNQLHVHGTILLAHNQGDVSAISASDPNMKDLVSSLYDLYQVSDHIHDGDQFALHGEIVAKCIDVHVVPVKPRPSSTRSLSLMIKPWHQINRQDLYRDYKIELVDDDKDSCVFVGSPEQLKIMVKERFPDCITNDSTLDARIADLPFQLVWGEGYANPSKRLVAKSFFSNENGYDLAQFQKVADMLPGSVIDLSEMKQDQTVKRLY